jgi:hypothetical protein
MNANKTPLNRRFTQMETIHSQNASGYAETVSNVERRDPSPAPNLRTSAVTVFYWCPFAVTKL